MSEHVVLILSLVAIFFSGVAIFFSWRTSKLLKKTVALQAKTVQLDPSGKHDTFNPSQVWTEDRLAQRSKEWDEAEQQRPESK